MDNQQINNFLLSKTVSISPFLLAFALVTLTLTSQAQSGLIPDRYLRIIPGVATRSDVEKIYQKNDPTKTFVEYDTSEFSVGIKYSLGPCELKLGIWGLPESTVEEVFYDWSEESRFRLRDIILDIKRFEKRRSGDVTVHDYYVNDESGISVVYDRTTKSVEGIRINLSAKLKEKYACRKGSWQSTAKYCGTN